MLLEFNAHERHLHHCVKITVEIMFFRFFILQIITVEPCILEQIDYLWGLAVAKPMI